MSKMLDAGLRIPEGEERVVDNKKTKDLDLVIEMLRLQAKTHSQYLITVEAPEVQGLHDDLSDAYGRAVYLASEYAAANGNSQKNTVSNAGGSSVSYKQYYRKQKMNAVYTNRPSSGIQMELSRSRNLGSLSRYGR